MKGKLVIISAPSGAGKSTIIRHLLDKGMNLEFSISATTRAPRGREKDGNEYYFLSVSDFRERVKNGDFIEWEEVYKDQLYGTLKSEIDRIWSPCPFRCGCEGRN
jgi:guanylate kinase